MLHAGKGVSLCVIGYGSGTGMGAGSIIRILAGG